MCVEQLDSLGEAPVDKVHRADSQAISILSNLVSSGYSCHGNTTSSQSFSSDLPSSFTLPVFVPPANQLSLISTLIVHPLLTSPQASKDHLRASNAALKLLSTINKVAGPLDTDFSTAFSFAHSSRSRRHGTRRRGTDREASPADDDDESMERINTEIANGGSVWARADDFWHVVGWAFNCSVAYPKRWARWKLWLSCMLDILEDDWKERVRLVTTEQAASEAGSEEAAIEAVLATSLIVQYLGGGAGAKGSSAYFFGGKRRVVRAIFADGSAKAQQEFRAIFPDEAKEAGGRASRADRKARLGTRVNVDEEVYGDYLNEEEYYRALGLDDLDDDGAVDDGSGVAATVPLARRRGRRRAPKLESDEAMKGEQQQSTTSSTQKNTSLLGGIESLLLRQRLLSLVSPLPRPLPHTPSPFPSLILNPQPCIN